MLKNIAQPFAILSSVSISAPITVSSSVSAIKYLDSLSVQFNWAGNWTGNFSIDGSLDFAYGTPQTGPGATNAGNWTSLTLSPSNTTIGSGSVQPILVNLNQLAFPYMRVTFTNSSGTGAISAFIMGKSLG